MGNSQRSFVSVIFLLCQLALVLCNLDIPNVEHMEIPEPQEGHPGHQSRFDRNHIQNQDHILEHMDGVINKPESEMTEQELQFHYFKLHDYDNNNMLDGLEIVNAMTHYHKGDTPDDHHEKRMSDDELMSVIDDIMKEEDLNQDGYIYYSEFISAQRAQNEAEAKGTGPPQDPQHPVEQ